MNKIIECVPNFSEGREQSTISTIASAIKTTPGASLLDVDAGPSTNRTVYTFVGNPDAVVNAAFNAAAAAARLIDMRQHRGQHPRLGAMDVCPFIPVRGATMQDCVQCVQRLGERLSTELGLCGFFYGYAATHQYRSTVPQIRNGEYEKLNERITDPEWKPDFGEAKFNPKWGATMLGARKFLIAYNVNLISTKEQAHRIALNIREVGRGVDQPGRLKGVQGMGWYLDEEDIAQVSVNITDFELTPLHTVFEECKKDASELKLCISGSQIVGVVPLAALLQAADFYIQQEQLFILEERQRVRLAIERLGLSSLGQFDANKRVIEYMIDECESTTAAEASLCSLSIRDFVLRVGARTPAPGGGSVSAVVAATAAALGSMAALLTYGNRRFESLDSKIRQLLPPIHAAARTLLQLVDADSAAFTAYMQSCKLPGKTPEQLVAKRQQQQETLRQCVDVPLHLAREADSLWPKLVELAKIVNINCKSDLQVAAKCMETAIFGACCNVRINLGDLQDQKWKESVEAEVKAMLLRSETNCKQVLLLLSNRVE